MSDEVGSLLSVELYAILELHKLEVLLDVVAEGEDIAMLTADGKQLLVIEMPDFVVVVLQSAVGLTFIFMTE
jgi:hypothetical protein